MEKHKLYIGEAIAPPPPPPTHTWEKLDPTGKYKGGPRTQIFKGEGGGKFFPKMGFLRLIPIETLYHL